MKKLVPIPPESLKRSKKNDLKDFGYQVVSVKLKDGRVFAQAVASDGCLKALFGKFSNSWLLTERLSALQCGHVMSIPTREPGRNTAVLFAEEALHLRRGNTFSRNSVLPT